MSDYIGMADNRLWLRCKGYKSAGGPKHRPQPESGKKTILGRPAVGSHSYEVADARFETLVKSFTLMDAILKTEVGSPEALAARMAYMGRR